MPSHYTITTRRTRSKREYSGFISPTFKNNNRRVRFNPNNEYIPTKVYTAEEEPPLQMPIFNKNFKFVQFKIPASLLLPTTTVVIDDDNVNDTTTTTSTITFLKLRAIPNHCSSTIFNHMLCHIVKTTDVLNPNAADNNFNNYNNNYNLLARDYVDFYYDCSDVKSTKIFVHKLTNQMSRARALCTALKAPNRFTVHTGFNPVI